MWQRLRSTLSALRHRQQFESDMSEELRFHVDERTADLIRTGLDPVTAARRARMEFGSADNAAIDCRQSRGLRALDELQQHVRYALRLMRRTPAFTATTLATLAICLGANLTIFAVVDAILLRPLPFPDADRLVNIYNTYPRAGVPDDGSSVTNYYERRGQIAAFESLSLYKTDAINVGAAGATERQFVTRVTPEFFDTLGVRPVLGRPFTDAEMRYGTSAVVILTDTYWREHFQANPQAIGQTLRADGVALTIVGVLPPSFSFLSSTSQLYLPRASEPDERGPDRRHSGSSSHMVARLRPGATIADAQAQLDAHNRIMERTDAQAQMIADAGFRSVVEGLRASHVASIRPTLVLVQAGVLVLLLIGGVNVSGLLMIRANGRVKELAVRQALGAHRRHVIAEVVVETTILALAGGLLGLGVGAAGITLLTTLGADRLPLGATVAFDARLAAIALASALVAGLVMSVPVAWYHLRFHSSSALNTESRGGTTGAAAARLRHGFLVAQIALAFMLLTGAGLLELSLRRVMEVPPGFVPAQLLSAQVSIPWQSYQTNASKLAFIGRLTDALSREPGVEAAGIATNVPFSGNTNKSSATVKGFVLRPGDPPRGVYSYGIGGNYFAAMGMTGVEGRLLDQNDAGRRVCVVDEDFAQRSWPRGQAVGQRLFAGSTEGPDAEAFTVVGVVSPVRQAGLASDEHIGAVYYPYSDFFDSALYVMVRAGIPPDALAGTVRRTVRGLDPELPVNNVRSMDARIANSLTERRSPAVLAMVFGVIALLLTAIGTYGVLSFAVSQRRREIGLRMALGARPGQIRGQFLTLAARLLVMGSALGVIGSWMTGRAMQAMLFHTPALPLSVALAVAAGMAAVCLAACLIPSVRAARISPAHVLAEP